MKRHTLAAAITLGALLVSGCANHLPQRSEHEERTERRLLSHSLQIDLGEPAVLATPQRLIRIHEQQSFSVKRFEVTRRYDRYTPYQAWRELYEVPLGAVAVVAGTGANVLNVLLLGSLPTNATRGWISYGMAGLNPFMNTESNGRSQQNLAKIEETLLDERVEYVSLPWSERLVTVKADTHTHELLTDRNGILHLNLLDSPFADHDLTHVDALEISVIDEQKKATLNARLGIEAALRKNLVEAHDLVFANLEDDDVNGWVYRVKRLAELGLEQEASELEQSVIELSRNDPQLQQDFVDQLLKDTGRIAQDLGLND